MRTPRVRSCELRSWQPAKSIPVQRATAVQRSVQRQLQAITRVRARTRQNRLQRRTEPVCTNLGEMDIYAHVLINADKTF